MVLNIIVCKFSSDLYSKVKVISNVNVSLHIGLSGTYPVSFIVNYFAIAACTRIHVYMMYMYTCRAECSSALLAVRL